MKIKRRKKNDRMAFFHMHWIEYLKYRFSINPERRTDQLMSPAKLQARDRVRAAKFRHDFQEGPGIALDQIIVPRGTLPA